MKKLILLSAITFWFNLAMGQGSTPNIDTFVFGYVAPGDWEKPTFRSYTFNVSSKDSLVIDDSLQTILYLMDREDKISKRESEAWVAYYSIFDKYNKLVREYNSHIKKDREQNKWLLKRLKELADMNRRR